VPSGRLDLLRQLVHVTPERLPGGALTLRQEVECLRVANGSEVGVASPVDQPLLDGLFQSVIIFTVSAALIARNSLGYNLLSVNGSR
jgi:hypothetical protein